MYCGNRLLRAEFASRIPEVQQRAALHNLILSPKQTAKEDEGGLHHTSTISWTIISAGTTVLLSCDALEVPRLVGPKGAVTSSNSDPKAVDTSLGMRFALFVHRSLLQRFSLAPCLTHTPPFTATFEQPSLLHRFTFAPCLTHTPSFTALFVQPSLLHELSFAPCLTHTPSFTALFVQPSLLHELSFAPCFLHTPSLTT